MGKYGTNLEGFGGFEGGVNADKGAPLISTSSDGATALLFGPAALREIQAGVANGDFAIPPDEAGSTITDENPLPYWTFTDVNSAGAITCAVIEDATAGSGNVLRWSVAASTASGKSATLSRFVPVSGTKNQAFAYAAEMTVKSSASTASLKTTLTQQYYKIDQATTTGTAVTNFGQFLTLQNTISLNISDQNVAAPSDAAFLLITITISSVSTTPASTTTCDLFESRMIVGDQTLLVAESTTPASFYPTFINQQDGVLRIRPGVSTKHIGKMEVEQGIFTAANIASGTATVDPVTANVVSSVNVTGLSVKTSAGTPTADNVSILVTAISAAAALRSCTASAPTFSGSNLTGFTANIFRTNTTATGVWFLAIGR
jgi:hypothetical protein